MCKAILEQGINSGKQCDRPNLDNEYCGKHQKQFLLETGLKAGKKKCSTHRCIELINTEKYCEKCELKRKDRKLCIAILEQQEHKGTQCKNKASDRDFCGIHIERAKILTRAKELGVRICDDGRRACKNETIGERLHCEVCLKRERVREKTEYDLRKGQLVCLTCRVDIDENVVGFRKDIQKCKECYEKSKKIERERHPRSDRNYLQERFANLQRHYNEYVRGSNKRHIEFELTIEEFDIIVNSPCRYCKHYVEYESGGIDRINSDIGYINGNIVPCCESCNMMKGSKTQKEFLDCIHRINEHFIECDDTVIDTKRSFIRKNEIIYMYNNGLFPQYIEWCKSDKRTTAFIEKLEAIGVGKTEIELRNLLRNAIRCDVNFKSLNTRQRISRKELFGLIERKHYDTCVSLYESVFGKTNGFREDIQNVKTMEELNTTLTKHQNKRNR